MTSLTIADVRAAAERLRGRAHRTPVLTSRQIDQLAGRRLFFKCENFQRVGAFKFRGACNAVQQLGDDLAARGVVTHSSGNHAAALALAARERGIPAYIVMPRNAPPVKQTAVEGYGGRITLCEPTQQAREEACADLMGRTGATLIHPYDNDEVIAGQGTAALELLEEVPDLDAVIAPVGGGGLLSGTAIAAHGIVVLAAEPLGADDAARSMAGGVRLPQLAPNTIADGLLTSLGERNWAIVRSRVKRILTVDDDRIIAALRLIMERMKIVVEPSSAVPLAALLDKAQAHARDLAHLGRVGVILSGGNVDLARLGQIFARA